MNVFKEINNLIIIEKSIDEVPFGIDDNRNFLVKVPDGRILEDNLLESEAIEFCNETKDFVQDVAVGKVTCLATLQYNDGSLEEREHSADNMEGIMKEFLKWNQNLEVGDKITFEITKLDV